MSKSVKTGENRLKNGRFALGNTGNPKGRPRKPEVELLREALEKAKKKNKKDFLEHFVERAFKNDSVAVALAKKLIPDKLEGEGFDSKLSIFDFGKLDAESRERLIVFLRAKQGEGQPA